MSRFIAFERGVLTGEGFELRCVLGKGGLINAADKREGDGASPIGEWPMRRVFYRADRLEAPETGLETLQIRDTHGWCDAPNDPQYNRLVTRPYPASHELMWREDHAYDVVVELGYNDTPPEPGRGSAIFMHVAQPDFRPTEGCVALELSDLLKILGQANVGSTVEIRR